MVSENNTEIVNQKDFEMNFTTSSLTKAVHATVLTVAVAMGVGLSNDVAAKQMTNNATHATIQVQDFKQTVEMLKELDAVFPRQVINGIMPDATSSMSVKPFAGEDFSLQGKLDRVFANFNQVSRNAGGINQYYEDMPQPTEKQTKNFIEHTTLITAEIINQASGGKISVEKAKKVLDKKMLNGDQLGSDDFRLAYGLKIKNPFELDAQQLSQGGWKNQTPIDKIFIIQEEFDSLKRQQKANITPSRQTP